MIYKICSRDAWEAAVRAGVYRGSPDDARDGFIHFSKAEQLKETLRKHFAGQVDLVLLEVPPEALGAALRYEPSRGGDLFPHLYGELDPAIVTRVLPFPWGEMDS